MSGSQESLMYEDAPIANPIILTAKERKRLSDKLYRDNNKEIMKNYQREYRLSHKKEAKEYQQEYRKNNKKRKADLAAKYYIKNEENINKTAVIWNHKNPQKRKMIQEKHYKKTNQTPKGRLSHNMRTAVYLSLNKNKHGVKWQDCVGYTYMELKTRLLKTMPEGYTWNDYLEGNLQVDHIIPISAFNFEKIVDIDFKRCWALKNLQFLSTKENLQKHNKLDHNFQPAFKF